MLLQRARHREVRADRWRAPGHPMHDWGRFGAYPLPTFPNETAGRVGQSSTYDGEAPGPADCLACGQRDEEEPDRLEFVRPGEGPGVDRVAAARRHRRDEGRLGVVVTGDKHGGG